MQGKSEVKRAIALAINRARRRGRYLFEHTSLSLFRSGTRTGMPLKTKDVTDRGNRAFCLLLFIWHTHTHPIMDNKEPSISSGGELGQMWLFAAAQIFLSILSSSCSTRTCTSILQAGCTLCGDGWLYRFVPSSGAHVLWGILFCAQEIKDAWLPFLLQQ